VTPGAAGVVGYNPYSYVAGNPVSWSDPSGAGLVGDLLTGTIGRTAAPAAQSLGFWTKVKIGLFIIALTCPLAGAHRVGLCDFGPDHKLEPPDDDPTVSPHRPPNSWRDIAESQGYDWAQIEESWANYLADESACVGLPDEWLPPGVRASAARSALLRELTELGIRHTPSDVIFIGRDASGRIVFLETGTQDAGLRHIISRYGSDFEAVGIEESDIGELVFAAVTRGRRVGIQGTRAIFEVEFRGVTRRVAVTIGSNGFIVGANPA